MSAALHLNPWTEQRLALESESKGRPVGTLAGSHIADLVALKKTVILCDGCVRKWGSARNGYVTQSRIPFCSANCDGCCEMGTDRRLFLHHSQLPR
jgi:hypothetical protein